MIIDKNIEPDKLVLQRQNEAKRAVKNLGNLKILPGQSLYELDPKEGMIRTIDVNETVAVDLAGGISKKVLIKDEMMYTVALNLKNAERKFLKMLDQ